MWLIMYRLGWEAEMLNDKCWMDVKLKAKALEEKEDRHRMEIRMIMASSGNIKYNEICTMLPLYSDLKEMAEYKPTEFTEEQVEAMEKRMAERVKNIRSKT